MNTQYFSKEEIANGTFDNFLHALIEFGQTSKVHFNDIRVVQLDCNAVQLEWEEINYQHQREEGEFVFVDSDHAVLKEVILPDNSTVYVFDEDEDQTIKDWLKDHPKWKRSRLTGKYYDSDEKAE